FNVLYRKQTAKKHRTWEEDGFLVIHGKSMLLKNSSDTIISRGKHELALQVGDEIKVGQFDVLIDSLLHIGSPAPKPPQPKIASPKIAKTPLKHPINLVPVKATCSTPVSKKRIQEPESPAIFPKVFDQFKMHTVTDHINPDAENAILMNPPPDVLQKNGPCRTVVIDSLLAQHLRDYQIEGIRFMYDGVMGFRPDGGQGVLVAYEMGLGKTLMAVTLIWTLLRQSPYVNESSVISKCVIVCPKTLTENWRDEFRKWLGRNKVAVLVGDSSAAVRRFFANNVYSVMIIGYDRFRLDDETILNADFDLLICDEGHRLKNASTKSSQALNMVKTPRRIILTGTPIQNDLAEFYCMVDFVNPGFLGTYQAFKKRYETPIFRSRQTNASSFQIMEGKEALQDLANETSAYIIRKRSSVLLKHLPPRSEYVVFCAPSNEQKLLFRRIIQDLVGSTSYDSLLESGDFLKWILYFRKLSTAPCLLTRGSGVTEDFVNDPSLRHALASTSGGKLVFLKHFLTKLLQKTEEKVVLVSNFTKTLDVLEGLITSIGATFLRLDGSTSAKDRIKLINDFNRTDSKTSFAFLLSAKSGGAGINLVGASRLFLVDSDWNPAGDLQAMARIHRDGQKRPVYIYRLLCTGTIDEKIYQRQLSKLGLSDSLVDEKESSLVSMFSSEDLKDLFSFDDSTKSLTHESLGCPC
ncbi:hypothetical protein CANCADRAFT_13489, partial [Tortispora caseinolytica NRRL Y-17796]